MTIKWADLKTPEAEEMKKIQLTYGTLNRLEQKRAFNRMGVLAVILKRQAKGN